MELMGKIMKHVVQVGLCRKAEYRFLAAIRSPQDPNALRFPGSGKNLFHPLPEGFNVDGDWMYHGIDCSEDSVNYFTGSEVEKFYHWAITDTDGTSIVQDFLNGRQPVEAPSRKIETFFDEVGINVCDLLVLDVEGWEGKVLKSLTGRIPIRYVIVEYHPEYNSVYSCEHPYVESEKEFKDIIAQKGFEIMCILETNRGMTREYFLRSS